MSYVLSGQAAEDVLEIFAEGVANHGRKTAQAYHRGLRDAFDLLASFPELARLRDELTPSARVHPHGIHVIVYEALPTGDVRILRVRPAREDWIND